MTPIASLPRLLVVLVVACMQGARCGRILIVPLSSNSHISAFTALSTALEQLGGHEIHMVVSKENEEASKAMATKRSPKQNHQYLTYPLRLEEHADDFARISKANFLMAMFSGYRILSAMVESVIGNEQLLSNITKLQPDLIIGDASASYGHWLTTITGIPSIEFDVGTSSGLLHSMWGGQLNPAYIPAPGTFFPSTGMTLWQRCLNVFLLTTTKVIAYVHWHWGPISRLARRHNAHLPVTGPSRPLLLLVNFDWALEPRRPVAPNTHFIGPLMPQPPAELPDDIKSWLETGSTGDDADALFFQTAAALAAVLPVVYVSFGASFLAPPEIMPALAHAIASNRGHMRFLLRMRDPEQHMLQAALHKAGVNMAPHELLLRPQYPQNDVLGHPAVAAFVTQGGYLSMQESAYHGVPVVGIPLTLGQGELVQHAEDHGWGKVVPKEGLMAGDGRRLALAMMEVVTNGSFKQQAANASARVKAHPVSPGQRATDLVNYALALPRTGSFLHTQGQNMSWWQVILLDVLLVYASLLGLWIWMVKLSLRLFLDVVSSARQQLVSDDRKGKRD